MARRKTLRSDLAWATPDRIFVKDFDLCQDLLGKLSLGDMAFLEMMDRRPTAAESTVFNAMALTLVEHGLTPSAIAKSALPQPISSPTTQPSMGPRPGPPSSR